MPEFEFIGPYETHCEIDGTVILAAPGEVHDLASEDPGPLWRKAKKAPAKKAPEVEPTP